MATRYFFEKRDGRRVQFDVEKKGIYKALTTESDSPLGDGSQTRSHCRSCDRRDLEHFSKWREIYEIHVVEHELLQANEYAIAESYITYRTQQDFERSKRRMKRHF